MRAFAGESMPWQPRKRRPAPRRAAPPAPSTAPGTAPGTAEQAAPGTAAGVPVPEPTAPEPRATGRRKTREREAPPNVPHVLIVGGGAIGGALAHDLALRGLRVTVVERGELTSGATGRGQGLLHSGARYATTDRTLAVDCAAENKLLRRIAPGSFEENDGLVVALTDEDADFAPRFLEACWQAAVPARRLTREEALRAEPGLNPALKFAVRVPDATMDTMRLPLRFFATARSNGAEIRPFTEVVAIGVSGGTVTGVRVRDRATDREAELGADLVVNAAGAWAGRVAALAGVAVASELWGGAMVAVRGRHTNMVVSRLQPPGDSDLLVPERRSTLLGALHGPVGHPDRAPDPEDAVEAIRREAARLVPALAGAPVRARWTAVSVRATADDGDGTSGGPSDGGPSDGGPSDRFVLVDHGKGRKPLRGFLTMAGGPTTTLRAAAQTGADLICARLGVERRCATMDTPLLPHSAWYSR